jgi:hypothetical protein
MSARARDAVVFAIFFRAHFGVHRSLRARCSAGILGSNILTMRPTLLVVVWNAYSTCQEAESLKDPQNGRT